MLQLGAAAPSITFRKEERKNEKSWRSPIGYRQPAAERGESNRAQGRTCRCRASVEVSSKVWLGTSIHRHQLEVKYLLVRVPWATDPACEYLLLSSVRAREALPLSMVLAFTTSHFF